MFDSEGVFMWERKRQIEGRCMIESKRRDRERKRE